MSNSHAFIEPAEEGPEHVWALAFPDLPEDKAAWLLGSILPDYRPTNDDPMNGQEMNNWYFRNASKKYRDIDLPLFKFSIIFLESGFNKYLDPKASSNFDWDEFFMDRKRIDLFLNRLFIPLFLSPGNKAYDAWLRIPLGTRADCYCTNPRLSPNLIERVEGISLPAVSTDGLWKALSKFPDRLGSLRNLSSNSQNSLDLSRLKTEEEKSILRRLYLYLLSETSKEILPALFDSLSFADAVRDVLDFIAELKSDAGSLIDDRKYVDETPQFIRDEPTDMAIICWDYLLARLPGAESGEAFSFLSRVLPLAEYKVTEYFGGRHVSRIRESAACLVDSLFREDVLPLVQISLYSTSGLTCHHDPYSYSFIREIDSRLAAEPKSQHVFLYSLLSRWVDTRSTEYIPFLKSMKSLTPMINELIRVEDSIKRLLTFPFSCDLEETAWRDAIAMVFAGAGNVVLNESKIVGKKNAFIIYALQRQSYEGPFPVLFSNPFLKYALPLFDQRFMDSLLSAPVLDTPEAERLLAVAIALDVKSAREFLSLRLQANTVTPFMPVLIFALGFVGEDDLERLSSPSELEELGLFNILPLGVLQFLVRDDSLLLEALFAWYFFNEMGEDAPSVADFRSRYTELLFERGLFPCALKPSAKRVLIKRSSLILDRIAENGIGDDAEIGLGLAAEVLHSADFNPLADAEFVEACKKAAQKWFDTMRAAARDGKHWRMLPSPAECLESAVSILWNVKGPWPVIKQLLTLFRHVPVASIGVDLDPQSADLVGSWQPVAGAIHAALDRQWSPEEGRALRAAMTHDLLEKLKPSKDPSKRTLVEPDENWRYAYVRAVADLGADPSDTGHFHHQVLDKCAVNDPSPRVRKAAEAAAASLKTRSGWKAGSSKRMLLHAWWWIRQAHLISFGTEMDREAALKRREAETRI